MIPARLAVVGLGTSGRAAAEVAKSLGAAVVGFDSSGEAAQRAMEELAGFVAHGVEDPGDLAAAVAADSPDVIVISPGIPAHAPLYGAAATAGIPVWSEVELAWQVRAAGRGGGEPAPWLALTGTNGKTTTVTMLASILNAAGLDGPAVGNVGDPIVRAAATGGQDFLAVELSSFQLHSTHSMSPLASACLNIAPDHLDWHGGWDAYWAAKAKVHDRTIAACIYGVAEPETRAMVEAAEVAEGARAIGVTLGMPRVGEVGLVEEMLVDRAFIPERHTHGAELCSLNDLEHLAGGPLPKHIISNALAAAALARAAGVPAGAVREGLRSYESGAHRIAAVATIGGVSWINDSKATNAHAAMASLAGLPDGSVVWIAGGLAKGATFDDLVTAVLPKLRAVVLIGEDRSALVGSLERHAPQIPRFEVTTRDHGNVMRSAVKAASSFARPGDTVLMAPASASMDQFVSYAHRGEAFTEAVHELEGP